MKCGINREDAIRDVLSRVESADGLVLSFSADVGTVLTFAELVKVGETSINGLFTGSLVLVDHKDEFVPSAHALVQEFNAGITAVTELPETDSTTQFKTLTSIVLDCVTQYKIPGMTVLGPYIGVDANSAFTTWSDSTTKFISTRFVVKFDEIAGYSVALPRKIKATHLTAVNGYLRRVVPGGGVTTTTFVELTLICEIAEDGRVFAREGTSICRSTSKLRTPVSRSLPKIRSKVIIFLLQHTWIHAPRYFSILRILLEF